MPKLCSALAALAAPIAPPRARDPCPAAAIVRPRSFAACTAVVAVAIGAVAVAAAPARAASNGARGGDIHRAITVLCMDLRAAHIDDAELRILSDAVATRLSRRGRVTVMTSSDIRESLGLEAEKRAVGCDADAECLSEIASALGADYIVTGSVGRLGDVFIVNLSITDPARAFSTKRRTIEVREVSLLMSMAGDAASELSDELVGAEPSPLASPLVWVGIAGIGVGLAGTAIGATVSAGQLSNLNQARSSEEWLQARDASVIAISATVGSAVLIAAGIGAIAWAALE